MQRLTRRFAVLASLALAAGAPRAARAADPVSLRLGSSADDDVTPILYAQKAGLFAKAGLSVDLQRFNTGSVVAAGVVSGSIDLGKSSLMALIGGHAHGLPFTIVAPSGIYQTANPSAMLIVRKDSPIRSARDLNGKTIPTAAIKELMQVATEAWVDKNGGDSSTIKFIEMPAAAMPAAIEEGRVAGAMINYPTLQVALNSGKFRTIAKPLDAIAERFAIAVWFTRADVLAKNRAAIEKFVAVLREASIYVNAHPAETADLLAAFAGLDPAIVAGMHRVTTGTALDMRDLQPLIDVAAKYKVIEKPFDARELVAQP